MILVVHDCLFFLKGGGNNRVIVDSYRTYFFQEYKLKIATLKLMEEFLWSTHYNQQTNNLIKQYDKLKKVSVGQGGDYATSQLDFDYFIEKLQINCCWFKQIKCFRCRLKINLTNYF